MATEQWRGDLLRAVDAAADAPAVFQAIDTAARQLGFEHCAFGQRLALPITRPRTLLMSSQPAPWRLRYEQAGYLDIDPTVQLGLVGAAPFLWSDRLFQLTPQLWDEAKSMGLRYGWAHAVLDGAGVASMLTLSRSTERISANELQHQEAQMRHLCEVAHSALGRALVVGSDASHITLTPREKEVLRWTADGKTYEQIGALLCISANTVHFHLKKVAIKLGTSSKTAMVVQALHRHLLD